jgi:hypothetical protein
MGEFLAKLRIKMIAYGTGLFIVMTLYSYFVSDTIETRITDAQMTKVDGRFMIATEDRPFVNYDARYRFKFNSGTVQNDAIRMKGQQVRIRKYGWRMPLLSMYENIVAIKEVR